MPRHSYMRCDSFDVRAGDVDWGAIYLSRAEKGKLRSLPDPPRINYLPVRLRSPTFFLSPSDANGSK